MTVFQKPPPLDITCTSADCKNDLHCFKQLKKMTPAQRGTCRACGADLIDWKRIHLRDRADAAYTFSVLKYEMIRHHFFHKQVDDTAVRHAQRKGRIQLKEATRHRLRKYLAPAAAPARRAPDAVRKATPFSMRNMQPQLAAGHVSRIGTISARAGR